MLAFALSTAALYASSVIAIPFVERQIPPPIDGSSSASCMSLNNSCNAKTVDLTNFYNYTSCVLLTTCFQGGENPAQVLAQSGAPATQPRLTQTAFNSISGGNSYISQQNYIDAYYHAISITPNGTYPDSVDYVIGQWQAIAAWTGFCATSNIPYSNFADWLEYSSNPGVCPAVASCDASKAAGVTPCVPQPPTDNGSCAEMVSQCRLWVTQGLFQNEYCVLASFCYAESTTDVLLKNEYPPYTTVPTSLQEKRLSQDVFNNMTNGAATMSQQNAIDAYYSALTGTWASQNGAPAKTDNNGPYPTSPDYVISFWNIISAWTGNCATKEIPYANLADYLTYAASSNYHPTC